MNFRTAIAIALVSVIQLAGIGAFAEDTRWTPDKANSWYAKQDWLVGSNFIPSNAINELEMWQPETFDAAEIDKELGWAQSIGMNTMRVFLHDLLWKQDAAGFKSRLDQFLAISAKHNIKPIIVLFDSCWSPFPQLGPQRPPIPGVHNSGWVQSPGAKALENPSEYPRLQEYVNGVVGAFAQDNRILAWDVWNEPNNTNGSSYGAQEPKNKEQLVATLLPQVFQWARQARPSQPLTSGVWDGNWADRTKLSPIQKIQLEQSDVISFHSYGWPEDFEQRVGWLKSHGRPIICTEYMARGVGSTFDTILPIAKRENVGAINWGLVAGRTQTYLPWDSWQKPYVLSEPPVWFHEVFFTDGKPYRDREVQLIKSLTRRPVRTSSGLQTAHP